MQEALRKLKDYRKQLADKVRSAVLEEDSERFRCAEEAVSEAIRIVQESPTSEETERLTEERDRLAKRIRAFAEQLERERASHEQEIADLRDRIGLALGLERPRLLFLGEMIHEVERVTRGRDDARAEIARLRGIIRQMVREDAERRIEALGVGEEAPE